MMNDGELMHHLKWGVKSILFTYYVAYSDSYGPSIS